jgi:hypothetical protein
MYPGDPGGPVYPVNDREVTLADVPAVLWRPADVLARVARQSRVLLGLAVVALWAAIGVISSLITLATGGVANQLNDAQLQALPAETRELIVGAASILGPLASVVSPFLFWLLIAGFVWVAARILGGRGSFTAMLAVAGVALVPMVLSALISLPFSAVQGVIQGQLNPADPSAGLGAAAGAGVIALLLLLVSLAALVWLFALVIIGTRFAMNLDGYGRSAGACALSCGGCLGIFVLLIVGLVVLGAALGG